MNTIGFIVMILAAVSLSSQQSEMRESFEDEIELDETMMTSTVPSSKYTNIKNVFDFDTQSSYSTIPVENEEGNLETYVQIFLKEVYCVEKVRVMVWLSGGSLRGTYMLLCGKDGCIEETAKNHEDQFDMALSIVGNADHNDPSCEGMLANTVRISREGTDKDTATLGLIDIAVIGKVSEEINPDEDDKKDGDDDGCEKSFNCNSSQAIVRPLSVALIAGLFTTTYLL